MGEPQHIMSKIVRVGLLIGVTLAFAASAGEAAAQGMGSGPIQTLPWAAKQRSKPNPDKEAQKGAEADAQPTDQLRAEPIVGNGPVAIQPKN